MKGKVGLGIALNLVSAISIVFINKLIYIHYNFPSMSLTLVHFIMTSIGLQIFAWGNIFSPKTLFIKKLLPLSASFCGFVVFTNLSLQYNSVGTYQLAKSMTTPMILFIQTVFYNKATPLKVKLTVVSSCVCFYTSTLQIVDTGFKVWNVCEPVHLNWVVYKVV